MFRLLEDLVGLVGLDDLGDLLGGLRLNEEALLGDGLLRRVFLAL